MTQKPSGSYFKIQAGPEIGDLNGPFPPQNPSRNVGGGEAPHTFQWGLGRETGRSRAENIRFPVRPGPDLEVRTGGPEVDPT